MRQRIRWSSRGQWGTPSASSALRSETLSGTHAVCYFLARMSTPRLVARTIVEAAVSDGLSRADNAIVAGRGTVRSLSQPEREVATLLAAGLRNRTIAMAILASEKTVERHVGSIFSKL